MELRNSSFFVPFYTGGWDIRGGRGETEKLKAETLKMEDGAAGGCIFNYHFRRLMLLAARRVRI